MSPQKKLTYFSKILIIVSTFLLLMDTALGSVLITRSVNKMKAIISSKITELSATAANLLGGDEILSLTMEDYENQTEKYQRNYDILAAFKTSAIDNNANLAYIYCIVKNEEGKMVFSVDPSDDPAEFLTEEALVTDALFDAFGGQTAFDKESYVDRWGDLYSAYSPVYGADKTTVKAVVGVDVWASWYKKEISSSAVAIGVITMVTLLLGIGATLLVTSRLRSRIKILTEEMDDLEGDVRELMKDIAGNQYIEMTESDIEIDEKDGLASIKQKIKLTSSEVQKYIEYAHKQAYTDSLSGLGNRNSYFELVKVLDTKIANGENPNFVVMVFDINGLKEINDNFGHETGDKAIIVTSKTVQEVFGLDAAFRIGGDELVVIRENLSQDEIEIKIKYFTAILKTKSKENFKDFELTVSDGYSIFDPSADKKYSDTFKRADKWMYAVKEKFYKESGLDRRR